MSYNKKIVAEIAENATSLDVDAAINVIKSMGAVSHVVLESCEIEYQVFRDNFDHDDGVSAGFSCQFYVRR